MYIQLTSETNKLQTLFNFNESLKCNLVIMKKYNLFAIMSPM